jgi:hypothetical protein
MKNNPPLLFITFINRFDGSCGTFGDENKYSLLSITLGQFVQDFFLNFKKKTTTM